MRRNVVLALGVLALALSVSTRHGWFSLASAAIVAGVVFPPVPVFKVRHGGTELRR